MVSNKKKDMLLTKFDDDRTLFNDDTAKTLTQEEFEKNLLGLFIFLVVFVWFIPHILVKNKLYLIATLYFSNLDMIGTVLGFSGGPYEICKYLYNPAAVTLFGFISSNIINYLALIGVGFVCIEFATRSKKIHGGLSMLLVILPITYLLPGNFIVYVMNELAEYLHNNNISYYLRWSLTTLVGFIIVAGIIGFERLVTLLLSPHLERLLHNIYKHYK